MATTSTQNVWKEKLHYKLLYLLCRRRLIAYRVMLRRRSRLPMLSGFIGDDAQLADEKLHAEIQRMKVSAPKPPAFPSGPNEMHVHDHIAKMDPLLPRYWPVLEQLNAGPLRALPGPLPPKAWLFEWMYRIYEGRYFLLLDITALSNPAIGLVNNPSTLPAGAAPPSAAIVVPTGKRSNLIDTRGQHDTNDKFRSMSTDVLKADMHSLDPQRQRGIGGSVEELQALWNEPVAQQLVIIVIMLEWYRVAYCQLRHCFLFFVLCCRLAC